MALNYQNPIGSQPNTNVTLARKCRRPVATYPQFAPIINTLSVTQSVQGVYSVVYINGLNFLPPCYGTTYVNFGQYTNIPIVFYSSSSLSFIVPIKATIGSYNVTLVNIYNGNYSPEVNNSYRGKLNYSGSVTYTIV